MSLSDFYEKTGNTWWVKCACATWFPASEQIVKHSTVKLLCPGCGKTFAAADSGDLVDPSSTHVKVGK